MLNRNIAYQSLGIVEPRNIYDLEHNKTIKVQFLCHTHKIHSKEDMSGIISYALFFISRDLWLNFGEILTEITKKCSRESF